MATLPVTSIVMAAATTSPFTLSTAASSSTGDKFPNTGKELVIFQNTSSQGGATVVVTVVAQNVDNFGGAASLHNLTISIPSSSLFGLTAIGPFPTAVFNDTSGFCNLTYSASGLNVGVFGVAPRS